MQNRLIFGIVLTGLLGFGGCQENQQSLLDTSREFEQAPTITAEMGLKAFQVHCATCHSEWPDVASIRGNASQLVASIKDGSMPPTGPLPKDDRDLLIAWLNAKAPDSMVNPHYDSGLSTSSSSGGSAALSSSGGSQVVTIAQVKPIFQTNCLSCHSGQNAPNLSTDASMRTNAKISLAEIKAGRMPPGGRKISAENIALIQAWIDGGLK